MKTVLMVLYRRHYLDDGQCHPASHRILVGRVRDLSYHKKFTTAGLAVKIAIPGGTKPTVNPLSFDVASNINDPSLAALKLAEVKSSDFDIIFLVGGYGPLQDMAVHPTIRHLPAKAFYSQDKIASAVSHGPLGFFLAHPDDTWMFKGLELTGHQKASAAATQYGILKQIGIEV